MNSIRNKIWYLLIDSKTNEKYSSLVVKKYQVLDLIANIFLALTTSTSIAVWAIWKSYPTLWFLIIGISQILAITKPYFLFPKYIKVFNEKSIRWQQLTVELEKLWFDLNAEKIDEDKACESFFELKRHILTFDNISEELIFFHHEKQLTLAEKECDLFISKI
jgi:hypothetical protein